VSNCFPFRKKLTAIGKNRQSSPQSVKYVYFRNTCPRKCELCMRNTLRVLSNAMCGSFDKIRARKRHSLSQRFSAINPIRIRYEKYPQTSSFYHSIVIYKKLKQLTSFKQNTSHCDIKIVPNY